MGIVVVGCGRSGTNVALEILRGSTFFKATSPPEEKRVFKRQKRYGPKFLTKCDTCRFSKADLFTAMNFDTGMKIVWTIRDPRDMLMSKFRRGVPLKQGGDCRVFADDATPEGAVSDIAKMVDLYDFARERFRKRIFLVKLEDMLRDTEGAAKAMSDFVGVRFEPEMVFFWKRMRVPEKAKRYHDRDIGQIEMWKHWKDVYNGWLAERFDMEKLFSEVEPYTKYFGYA